jgi:hypothetical protein
MLDGYVAVYRNNVDLFFYLIISADENELIAAAALNVIYDAVSIVLKYDPSMIVKITLTMLAGIKSINGLCWTDLT